MIRLIYMYNFHHNSGELMLEKIQKTAKLR